MKRYLLSKLVTLVCLVLTPYLVMSHGNHINGYVFVDEDSNSINNASDTGLAGVRLLLYQDVNDNDIIDSNDILLDDAFTLVGGFYGFSFPFDDDHKELIVKVDTNFLVSPFTPTTPLFKKLSFTKDQTTIDSVDFGFTFGECILFAGNVVHFKEGIPECKECEGGLFKMVVRLSDPTITSKVEVTIKVLGTTEFTDSVSPGGLIILMNADSSKIPDDLDFFINGVASGSIHTSCSQPIGQGVDFGSFEIFRSYSITTVFICPPGDINCGECDGGMKEITFKYVGPLTTSKIKITDKNGTLFDDSVASGASFTIFGPSGNKMGNEITIFIDNNLHTTLHTSCSKPINIGMAVGDLILTNGFSVKGGKLCTTDDPGVNSCVECKKEVTSLTLIYIGTLTNPTITVKKGKKIYFDGIVAANQPFLISPVGKDKKLEKEIDLYINNANRIRYKTNCKSPLAPGTIFGEFEVVVATTKGGKEICDEPGVVDIGTCKECKGGVSYLQLKYDGPESIVFVEIDGGSTSYFSDSVSKDSLFTIGSTGGSKLEKTAGT